MPPPRPASGDTIYIIHAYGSDTNCSPCWPASTAYQRWGLVTLIFDILTLKVVSESRVTWATSMPILIFVRLSVLDLGPMYATDRRQTDVRQHHRLMPPPRGRGITIVVLHLRKNITNATGTVYV